MKKMNNKHAFTLTELLIALTLVIFVIVLMVSVLKNKMPNLDRGKVRQAYSQVLKITENLLSDPMIYPDASGFAKMTLYTDPMTGEQFTGNYKFTNLFKSQLNILEEIEVKGDLATSKVPICCSTIDSNDCTLTSSTNTTCFKTNNGITYCLPKNTNTTKCFSSENEGIVIVKIYTTDDYTDKDGYYLAISETGKVSVLPIKIAFNEAYFSNFNFTNPNQAKRACHNNDIYNEYNHCKTNDFLLYTKVTD